MITDLQRRTQWLMEKRMVLHRGMKRTHLRNSRVRPKGASVKGGQEIRTVELLRLVVKYRRDGMYRERATTLVGRRQGMECDHRWSSQTKESCVGAGERLRTDLIGLLIVVGLYRRDGNYLAMAMLLGQRGNKGHKHPWISQCWASHAIAGETFRTELCELLLAVGLYRRGGKYLVMATLVGRRGGKWHNHPWSSSVRANCAGVGGTFSIGLCELLLAVGLYRRGGKYLVMATLAWRRGGKWHNHPWSRSARANCAGVGGTYRIGLYRLPILVGLYRRGGDYLVMATLVGRRGGKWHNHPWNRSVRASRAGVGGTFRIGLCRLSILVGLYRRGGDYLVMTMLAERTHPWINKVMASRAGAGIRIIRLTVVPAGM